MNASLLLALAALPLAPGEVSFVRQDFPVAGEALAARVVDVDGDGRDDLLLATFEQATRRRALRLHPGLADGTFAQEPTTTVPVLDDVLAFCVAEVRDDPGRELVFLTRAGAYAYSTAKRGYKGNIEQLVAAELLYDVPDPQELPWWPYVLPDARGDRLLLPEAGGFRVWGPAPADAERAADAPRFVELGAWFAAEPPEARVTGEGDDDRDASREALVDGALALTGNAFGLDVGAELRHFLRDRVSTRAPALADVDGDGRLDMLVLRDALQVYLSGPAGLPTKPTRVEPLPASIAEVEGGGRDIDLVDVDADGDVDLVVHLRAERAGLFTPRVHDVLVLRNDGRRLLPEVADDLRRLEGAWADVRVDDVDGDGRPDLLLEKAESPSELELVRSTDPRIETTFLVFRGGADGRFARRPDLEARESIPFTELGDAVTRSHLGWDCSGDGVHDRVEVDLEGNVTIRRLLHESSFFGGDRWTLEPSPWKTFPHAGSFRVLEVRDLNGDGLGDVLTSREDRVTLLLSRRSGGPR